MSRQLPRNSRAWLRFRPLLTALENRCLLSEDVLTYHDDLARTSLDPNETVLTPADVNVNTFGKLFTLSVDGKVDAQPLIKTNVSIPGQGTHNVLYVATEHDSVYAFDADTGAKLWQVSLLGPGETPSDPRNCGQITPEIGITGTPVIDPATGTMYLVAMSKLVSGGTTTYFQRLHALDITTGADNLAPRSIDSTITFPGKGPGGDGTQVSFDPKQYDERDALLLVNGVVYTSWASHCDIAPYTGWIIGFRANDLGLASVLNIDPNGTPTSSFLDDGSGNSFWNSGAGPAADASGNLYNISANGPFDPQSGDFGDSYLKISTGGGLAVADFFTPFNQQDEANQDEDLGSSGLLLLPDLQDAQGVTRHLAVGSGKDGNIYVVNRDNLGQFHPAGNSNIYQEVTGALGGSEYAAPAYFDGMVYFGAVGASLRSFTISGGKLSTSPTSQTANTFGYPGTSPAISSNGASDGIVWAAENGDTAVLHAYDALNLSDELYNSDQAANGRDHFGTGNKFITPTVANGKVYVATTNGIGVFGLLPAVASNPAAPVVVTPPPVVAGPQSPTVAVPASASSNPVGETATTLSVLGADPEAPESSLTYTWTAASVPPGAAAPSFSLNDTNAARNTTATFNAAGNYALDVTITALDGLTASSQVALTVEQTLTTISVSPATAILNDGATQQFTALAKDQFGAVLASQPAFAWSLAPGGAGSISTAGLYAAPVVGAGLATVLVSSGSVVGAAPVAVLPTAALPVIPPSTLFIAHINFSNNPLLVPAGYLNDIGLSFGARGNGLTFGWNANNTANAHVRNNPTSPDERYDSFIAMQNRPDRNASWSIAVPNGTYSVHLIAGDPNSIDGDYKIKVEGVPALNGKPTRSRHWFESTVDVTVSDGRLTVSNAPGARDNKIDAIDITQETMAASPGDLTKARTTRQGRPGRLPSNRRHGR